MLYITHNYFFCFLLLLKNCKQKKSTLSTEIQHTRCHVPSLQFPSGPRIILPAVWSSTSRWSLSVVFFICSGCWGLLCCLVHIPCKWQACIQWLMKAGMEKPCPHPDYRTWRRCQGLIFTVESPKETFARVIMELNSLCPTFPHHLFFLIVHQDTINSKHSSKFFVFSLNSYNWLCRYLLYS